LDKKKINISLIGMPGAGKTTIAKLLAAQLSLEFIDSDHLIEKINNQSIQDILESEGHAELRLKEEEVILSCSLNNTILATGGSAVYSDKAMSYLNNHSMVIYLDIPISSVMQRVGDYSNRGFAEPSGKSPEDVFNQRTVLYKKWCHLTIDGTFDVDTVAENIIKAVLDN
jgi:shikimate kinase